MVLAFRRSIRGFYLRLTMYKPSLGFDPGLNRSLLQLFSPHHLKPSDKQETESTCVECGTSTFGVSRPYVELFDMGMPGKKRTFHRDCLEKSKRWESDFDVRTQRLRVVKLSKLWKLRARPSRLETSSPPLLVMKMLDPMRRRVNFILASPRSIQSLGQNPFHDETGNLPKSPDGKPLYAYLFGLNVFANVGFELPEGLEMEDELPKMTKMVHDFGLAKAFGKENHLFSWVRKKTGHIYSNTGDCNFSPCPKCGRLHLSSGIK